MALELETVHWERGVDSVFEENDGVPHYNYRIQSRDTLGSSNLEVFVEEEESSDLAAEEELQNASRKTSGVSPPAASSRADSTGSTSSLGLKYNSSLPGECS